MRAFPCFPPPSRPLRHPWALCLSTPPTQTSAPTPRSTALFQARTPTFPRASSRFLALVERLDRGDLAHDSQRHQAPSRRPRCLLRGEPARVNRGTRGSGAEVVPLGLKNGSRCVAGCFVGCGSRFRGFGCSYTSSCRLAWGSHDPNRIVLDLLDQPDRFWNVPACGAVFLSRHDRSERNASPRNESSSVI